MFEQLVYGLLSISAGFTISRTPSDLLVLSRDAVLHIVSKPNAELLLKAGTAGRGFPAHKFVRPMSGPRLLRQTNICSARRQSIQSPRQHRRGPRSDRKHCQPYIEHPFRDVCDLRSCDLFVQARRGDRMDNILVADLSDDVSPVVDARFFPNISSKSTRLPQYDGGVR